VMARTLPSVRPPDSASIAAALARHCHHKTSLASRQPEGTLRLLRLIRVLRLIRGTGMHRIRHEARIHHQNVAKEADVHGGAPGLRLVARRLRKRGGYQLCRRLSRPSAAH
jgi:hypothetical protein